MAGGDNLIQFKVQGKVQGVCFRASTQEEAQRLGVKGWCHNHPDSSVEGVAVGPPDAIHKFKAFLEKGPPAAQVSGVEMIKETPGATEEEIKKALRGSGFSFEVRKYDKM